MATWNHQLTVLVDADTRALVNELVERSGETMGAVIRAALERGLPAVKRELAKEPTETAAPVFTAPPKLGAAGRRRARQARPPVV